ncbi:MAG: hypothetical protein ACK4F9_01065 [Brevinematia bacterium]
MPNKFNIKFPTLLLYTFIITSAILIGFSQENEVETIDTLNTTNYQTNQEIETNINITNIEKFLEVLKKEIPENYPVFLDYLIDERLSKKEDRTETKEDNLNYNISLNTNYDQEIMKEVILEEEEKKREYYKTQKPIVAVDIDQLESKVYARGNVLFGISYGTIKKIPDITRVPSSFIKENFNINQDMRIYSTSKIGNKVNIDIEFDQKSAINRFNVSYKEQEPPITSIKDQKPTNQYVDDKPFVRELTFGDVGFSKTPSKYLNYTAISRSAQGIKFVGQKNNFSIEAIGSLSTTISTKKIFTGTKRVTERTIKDIDFVKRKFFKLPDNNIDLNSLVVLVSVSINDPIDVYIDGIPFRKLVAGNDYLFDRFTSEIELRNNLEINKFLAVFYTHNSGQPITFSSNIYKGIGSDNKEYLYLFNANIGYSPYELKNIYSLGSIEISLSREIEISVYFTSDPTILAPIQFQKSDYYIDINKSIIRFNSLTPFISNANYNIYSLTRDPFPVESTYSMKVNFYETLISYQLDFDIVENSEEVKINGVIIPKDKYTIIYAIGRITFNDPRLINEGDIIEISYEYKPFFGGSQKISLGTIAEYKPLESTSLKLSTVFWTSQGNISAPKIGTRPAETGIITSIINRVDLGNILAKDNKNFSSYFDIEYSISLVNPNNFGASIIEDFDSNKKSILLTKDEDSWYLSSPDTNIGCYYTNRAKLYYKDYRQYLANESFTLMSYTWTPPPEQLLSYSQKPGPYIAGGGRLNPQDFPNVSQHSLVLDYDFSGGDWVGIMLSLSSSGMDLSDLSEIILSYKLQMDNDQDNNYDDNNTNKLLLYLQLGNFSEDIDGDNVLDYEITTSQDGFEFNDPITMNSITKIGGGRKGGGNGRIDSEDFNKNGRLDTNENFISFSNTIQGKDWQKFSARITNLTSLQIDVLRKAYMFRIILKKIEGIKGRVIIDEIQLKFRTTPIYKVDSIPLSTPYQIRSTSISVFDSPLYFRNRFFKIEAETQEEKERLQEYSYLHNTSGLSVSEAKSIDEASLRIIYNLSNSSINTNFIPYQGGREGVTVIKFNSSENFSIYSKLVMYVFIPSKNELDEPIKPAGDTFSDENVVIRIISKDKDYFEFTIPLSRLNIDRWNRIEIRIKEDYKLILNNNIYDTITPTIYGFPSIRDINSLELGIKVKEDSTEPQNIGEIWFNEIHLSGVEWLVSSAINSSVFMFYNNDLKISNFPILSKPYLTFSVENIFPNFKGTGGKENLNTFSITHYYSSDIFKYLNLNYLISVINNNSYQDPTIPEYLLYDDSSRNFKYSLTTKHNINLLPLISYSFSDRQTTSSKNGLVAIGTNTFLQKNIIEDITLDSSITISYKIPYINLGNSLGLSSSYSARNHNTTTNNISYFVNPSYQNWNYTLSLNTSFHYSLLSLNNSFRHSETFSQSETNIIPIVEELSKSSILERNRYSLNLLFEGFKERGKRKEIVESDTLSISMINLLNIMNIYITPLYEFKDFNFVEISNTTRRDLRMDGKITYRLDFNLNRSILNSVSINSSLNTVFSANSIDYSLKWYDFYTNNIYRGVVAIPFYEYLGIFGYQNLSNALSLVSSLYDVRSIVNHFASSGISISLNTQDDLLLSLIPRNYSIDYSTTTIRELSSFKQSTRFLLTTVSYIAIDKLDWLIFRRNENIYVNDIQVNFSFSRDENFNLLLIRNKIDTSVSFSGLVKTQQNFSISYLLSYSYQENITNLPSFYSNFNIGLVTPSPLLNIVSHNLRISYSYTVLSESDIDLFIIKTRANSTIENKDELNLYSEYPWYNDTKFQSFRRKVFELNLYHETSIRVSDFIQMSGYLKFLLIQMSEIYSENGIRREKFFEVLPGIELGINLRVTF